MPFTPAQEAAIHARNRELLVSAAAGSGKTRVLIERIYALLRDDGLSIDRMLVVTFTHAAAAEMRERLQARLAEAAAGDRRMRAQAELLETAQISTLHSFCQRLVREYFQEVDIDPQSALGDETLCANLRAAAKADAMDWLYGQAAFGAEEPAALTAKFEDKQIEAMLDALYPFLLSLPDPFGWLAGCADKRYTADDLREGELARTLLSDCRLLADGAADLAADGERLLLNPLFPDKYAATVRADRQAVEGLREAFAAGLPGVIAAARGFSLDRLPAVRNLEGPEAALRDAYKENRERLKQLAGAIADHLPEEPETAIRRLNAMQPALRGLRALAGELDARYAARKRERALLDFADLERMALRILANPAIREEVAARYDAVFVDEYQDISGVQEAILNAVKRDVSRETSLPPQRYFYVGDVKQSIYRFRQADPTLFMEKARAFSPDAGAPCRRISLNANFRSRERVLSAVNRVFERVMRPDVTEIDYDAEARLYPGLPSRDDPPASLHLFTQSLRAADRVKLQAYALGREILRRVGEPVRDRDGNPAGSLRYRDIAILAPKMKDVAAVVERTLGEMGIPVYCDDGAAGMQSEEIAQAINHLRLMDNIADDLSLIACLRSPAVGMDERELAAVRLRKPDGSYLDAVRAAAESPDALGRRCADALRWLSHERFLLRETPLDEYLWGWLERSGLYAFYGCQPNGRLRQANLRMLCQKAGDHVRRRGGDLRDFLDGVEANAGVRDSNSPTVLSPWEDVVRVMTIHKSKGLEFPVVFVMGLEDVFAGRRGGGLPMHPRLGVALPYVNEQARTTAPTLLEAAIDLRRRAEDRAERARLLYVAMTRAADELILLGCGNDLAPEDAADGFARNAGDSAYAVFSAGSMLRWVCLCAGADDAVEVCGEEALSDSFVRGTAEKGAFSTQSTSYPQKMDGWRIVFHSDEREAEAARRYARGRQEHSDLERRRAKLRAVAEKARLLATEAGPAAPAATLSGRAAGATGAPSEPYADTPAASMRGAADAPTGAPLRRPADGGAGEAHGLATGAAVLPFAKGAGRPPGAADPIAPPLGLSHSPFKVGATALARAEAETLRGPGALIDPAEGDPASVETLDWKRLPLPLARPRLMHDLPELPAFLRAPQEQTGLRRGVATHKALSLLRYDALRAASGGLAAEVEAQLDDLARRRLLEAEERRLVLTDTIVRFLQSPTGREALAADTVRREWSFNLRLPERDGLMVQGVIDLCYQVEGAWALVDYKTDRVASAEELWMLYGGQIALYRRALETATGIPVGSATLFSLSLGEGATVR